MPQKILVVDDDKDIRNLIAILLTQEGYTVEQAKDGHECLKKLKKNKFDLVLLDFFMPELSGIAVAQKIREDAALKDTHFAFLTAAWFGKIGEENIKKLKSLDYIKKPFDNDDLIARVKKMLSQ